MKKNLLNDELTTMLNKELLQCVVTGCSVNNLRNMLIEQFGFSRTESNTIIYTGIAWIQTERAAKRYQDEGLTEYMILGREEETHCDYDIDCREMDGKVFRFTEMVIGKNAPPFHPNCRCRIKPIMKDDILRRAQEENRKKEQEKRAIKAEADRLREEAKQLRAQAKTLKKEGKTEQAKLIEAEARALEKKYKSLYEQLNNN